MSINEADRREPRYAQLAAILKARIEAGDFSVGSFLPTEIELCDEFGVSRHTVREALRRLTEAGFVQRRQGSGSQVVTASPQGAYVHSMRSLNGLFQYAADTELRIQSVGLAVPDGSFANALGESADRRWLIVEGLRIDPASSQPICRSIVFINRAFSGIAKDLPGHSGAIYSLIEDRYGVQVNGVEQEISAMPITPQAARALGVSRKIWAVRVVRRYLDSSGKLILVSVNDHPGDRFSYTMQLQRDQRGRP
jgi:GntR family transcriptional regulator